jgi:hypothetical protein
LLIFLDKRSLDRSRVVDIYISNKSTGTYIDTLKNKCNHLNYHPVVCDLPWNKMIPKIHPKEERRRKEKRKDRKDRT